jgi:hypothetical protein
VADGLPPVSIEFGLVEWEEEVERYDRRSPARAQAQSARKTIETGTAKLDWKRCKTDGSGATRLPGCRKLYVPLGRQGASDAPYGFVFQLIQKPDGSLAWNMIAFGERHPPMRELAMSTSEHISVCMVAIRSRTWRASARQSPHTRCFRQAVAHLGGHKTLEGRPR